MIRLLSTVLQVFSIYTVHLDLCKIQFISCREFTIEPKICYFILCFKILNSIKREWRENNVSWYDFPVKNEEKYHIPGILQVWAFELLNCELFWISYFIFFKLFYEKDTKTYQTLIIPFSQVLGNKFWIQGGAKYKKLRKTLFIHSHIKLS